MNCKRCNTPLSDSDRFCRNCGKRVPVFSARSDEFLSAEEGPREIATPLLSTRKKWVLFSFFAALLVLTALALVFLPHFKQSFMSPAAYYLESENREIRKFSQSTAALLDTLSFRDSAAIDGTIHFETEGKEYDTIEPFLKDLQLQANYRSNAKDRTQLSLAASYEDEVICRVLASLVKEDFSVYFPEMTQGEVTAKLSTLLQKSAEGTSEGWKAITGSTREELSAWLASYLEPLLLEALNDSEQTVDFAVLDGSEVSTVTFHLTEKQAKEIVRECSSMLRRDPKLSRLLSNLASYITASAEFRTDFIAEFNLTETDLREIPLLGEIGAALPEFELAEEGTLLYLLNTSPEKEDVDRYVEALADRVSDFADTLALPDGISLTAYYQGTDLVGRALKQGTSTVFECFRYRREGDTILEVRFELDHQIYHLTHIDSSSSSENRHEISLTRRTADVERSEDGKAEAVFSLSIKSEKNPNVNGVEIFLGDVRLTIGHESYILTHSKVSDEQTHLVAEKRTSDDTDKVVSRFKVRAYLKHSSAVKTDDITSSGSSDFGKPAFAEFTLSLKRALQDHELFERFFGEGSLEKFLAEEEQRLQEALQEEAESEENDSKLPSDGGPSPENEIDDTAPDVFTDADTPSPVETDEKES